MNIPPNKGPATEAMPNMDPKAPINAGLLASGTEYAMIVRPPLKMPATPAPATALPIINVVEFGAIPHISEPSSKTDTAPMKNHLIEKDW